MLLVPFSRCLLVGNDDIGRLVYLFLFFSYFSFFLFVFLILLDRTAKIGEEEVVSDKGCRWRLEHLPQLRVISTS